MNFKSNIRTKFSAFHCLNRYIFTAPGGVFKLSRRAAFGLLGVAFLTDLLRALSVRSKMNRASVSSGYPSDFTLCPISIGASPVLRIYAVFLNPQIK